MLERARATWRRRDWKSITRDSGLARGADCLIALAFAAVLVSPLHFVPRLFTYLLMVLTLCRPASWRAATGASPFWPAAALLGYLLLTMCWSENFDAAAAARFVVRALVIACFLVAFADSVRRGDAHRRIGRWFAWVGGAAAVFAIAAHHVSPPPMGRLIGPGQIQNELVAAEAFTVGVLFAVDGLCRRADRAALETWLLVASAGAMACAVALTGSRTAWAALLLGCGVLLLAHRTWTPRHLVAWACLWAGLLLAVMAALVLHEGAREWLLPRGTSFRPVIWTAAWRDMALVAPWFGSGLLADDNVAAVGIEFLHPHNLYLSIFYQGGGVGVALFFAVLGVTGWCLLRRLAAPDAKLALALLATGAAVWLLDGHQVIHKVGVVWWLFWLAVATAIGARDDQPNGRLTPDDSGRTILAGQRTVGEGA